MPERAPDSTIEPQREADERRGLAAHFAAIEVALAATPRGRWFLAEYLRRNRSAETDMLLEAIARLEAAVQKPQRQATPGGGVLNELVEMSQAIARTRREIAQIRPPHQFDKQLVHATEELDQIVEATEKATSDILEAAEEIQEVAWTLRERGVDIGLCDMLDQRATDIYTACSFQDITGQRSEKVVKALRFIEQRINAMIEIWGVDDIACRIDDTASKMQASAEATAAREDKLLSGPQRRGEGLRQDDVDRVISERAGERRGRDAEKVNAETAPTPGEPERFEPLDPLTVATLTAVKRAALFG